MTNFLKRVKKWLEPIGLSLLLLAFGWQCFEEKTTQMEIRSYQLDTNEKLFSIWMGIYDEAVHSGRYNDNTLNWVNYDGLNDTFKDWSQLQKELSTTRSQDSCLFIVRVVLYVIGSILVILSKIPRWDNVLK